MPIKRGRKAETLAAAALPLRRRRRTRARRGARIAAEAGGDPLDVWIKYIRWWQDRCVAGGPVQQLLPVLERYAFAFKEDRSTGRRAVLARVDLVRRPRPRRRAHLRLPLRPPLARRTPSFGSRGRRSSRRKEANAADKVFSRGIQMRAADGRLRALMSSSGRMMRGS